MRVATTGVRTIPNTSNAETTSHIVTSARIRASSFPAVFSLPPGSGGATTTDTCTADGDDPLSVHLHIFPFAPKTEPHPVMTAYAVRIVLALLLANCFHAAYGQAQRSSKAAASAIRSLIQTTEATNNVGDVEGWVRLFADDAVYMAPGSPSVTTKKGLIEVAKAGFRHQASIEIEPLEIRVCENWAFARTRVSGRVTVAETEEIVPVNVKQIVVYSRTDNGAWKIARLISNSNTE